MNAETPARASAGNGRPALMMAGQKGKVMIDWDWYGAKDRRVSAYIENPDTLYTVERCTYYDGNAARYIKALQAEIAQMQEYRQAVFDRMQKLYSTPERPRVTLTREKQYDNKVKYYLQWWAVPVDPAIPPRVTESTTYPGTERAQAIKDYKAAVKAHPGIDCEMNITKGRWER